MVIDFLANHSDAQSKQLGQIQPRSQSSSAISDVTSSVKLVGKVRTRFQASSGNSYSANWPGYEAGADR